MLGKNSACIADGITISKIYNPKFIVVGYLDCNTIVRFAL